MYITQPHHHLASKQSGNGPLEDTPHSSLSVQLHCTVKAVGVLGGSLGLSLDLHQALDSFSRGRHHGGKDTRESSS